MPEFTISKANPIHFEIQTGTGTINDGVQTIDGNFIFNQLGQYWNCDGLQSKAFCQKWLDTDVLYFQFIFDNSGTIPYIDLLDESGDFVGTISWTNPTTNTYEGTVAWVDYPDGCYQIRISSISAGANFLPCADSGTFETGTPGTWGTSTGTNNLITKVASPVHGGAAAASITAGVAPVAADREIIWCTTSFSLTANTIYQYSAWVYDLDANPFIQDGRQVSIDISDFSDADIISQTTVTPSTDGRDTWLFVDIYFRVNTDLTGQIKIVTNADPQSTGVMYVDDITIKEATTVVEALSDCHERSTDWPCHNLITYYNDDNGFDIYYTSGIQFSMRGEWYAIRFKMLDEDLIIEDSSQGESSITRSVNYKTYEFETDFIPPPMVESLCLALKHDNLILNGVPMVCQTDTIDPDWDDELKMARVNVDLRVKDYNYQNGSC